MSEARRNELKRGARRVSSWKNSPRALRARRFNRLCVLAPELLAGPEARGPEGAEEAEAAETISNAEIAEIRSGKFSAFSLRARRFPSSLHPRFRGTAVALLPDVTPLKWLRRYWPNLLLGAVPVAAALEFFVPERHTPIFIASVAAIVPLAVYMARATDQLASRLGGEVGGLLNATFGNAAELIIGALALRHGLTDLVKAYVGNLVCPASYNLGEDLQAVLLSVTEGEDKPLKYPTIFNTADVAVITKIDLADVVGFRREEAYANIAAVRPGLEIIETSARAGHSMQRWLERLEQLRTPPRGQIAGSIAIN